MKPIRLTPPLSDEDVLRLRAGDQVLITGQLLTARDAAHARLCQLIDAGEELPVDLRGQIIYFVGPTPAKPGQVIGSAGPTTSSRMDPYSPRLIALGLKGMIGKGTRGPAVLEALQKHRAVYFAAIGGAAAQLAKTIVKSEVIAYEELGTEAIRRLEVVDMPVVVANDAHGGDVYQQGKLKYRRERVAG